MPVGWYLMSRDYSAPTGRQPRMIPDEDGDYLWRPPDESEPSDLTAAPLMAKLRRIAWEERLGIWESIENSLLPDAQGRNRHAHPRTVSLRLFPVHSIWGGLPWPLPEADRAIYEEVVGDCAYCLMRGAIFPPWVFRDAEGFNRMAPHLISIAFLDAARRLDLSHIPIFVVGSSPEGIPVFASVPEDIYAGFLAKGSIHPTLADLNWPNPQLVEAEEEENHRTRQNLREQRKFRRSKLFPLVQEDRVIVPILGAILHRQMSQEDFPPDGCMAASKMLHGLQNLPAPTPGLDVGLFANCRRPTGDWIDFCIQLSQDKFELTHGESMPIWENSRMDVAHVALRAEIPGIRSGESPQYVASWTRTMSDMLFIADSCWCWDLVDATDSNFWDDSPDRNAWGKLVRFNGQCARPLPLPWDFSTIPSRFALHQR